MLQLLSRLLGLVSPLLPLLTGFLPGLTGVLPVIFASVKTYWKLYLIGLLLAVVCGSTFEWRHSNAALKTEKAAHAADTKSYRDAQAEAQVKVDADRARLLKQSKDQANAADKSYNALLTTYRANLLRFQAAQGSRERSGSATDSNPAQSSDGPSTGASVPQGTVSITMDDAGVCATNTARLSAAHDWALTLGKKTNDQIPKP